MAFKLNKWINNNLSELFMVLLVVTADCTTQHLFISISQMITSDWASSWAWAFGQLIFCILTYIVSIALSFMARFAEVSIAPAKPLSNTTAKLTFKLNEIFSMFWAVLHWNITTFRANKLLCFKRSTSILFVHGCHTIFSSSEVRPFTFEAHEVSIDNHRIILRLSIINGCFIC